MRKRDFEFFIRRNLKAWPLEKQESILETIEKVWLPSIQQKFKTTMKRNYIQCAECNRYSLKKLFQIEYKNHLVKGVTVQEAFGYGDNDIVADVTYRVTYYVCPFCGGMTEQKRKVLKEENRRRYCE